MSNVMVPLDGSRFAEHALPMALAIARRSESGLHLVRVRTAPWLDSDLDGAEDYVKVLARQLEARLPGKVTPWILNDESGALRYPPPTPDSVAEVLASHAQNHDVGMIVMATHGRGGVQRAWLGSVADSFARITPRPVLLLRPHGEDFNPAVDATRGIRHILVPLDGSETAEQAIRRARLLGERFGARYTLLRIISPLSQQYSGVGYDAYPLAHMIPMSRRAAADYLDRVAADLRGDGLTVETAVVEDTSPAPAITDYANEHDVETIAITTSGAGGIRRLLFGSVADKVVRNGEVPVLVCNVRHEEAASSPDEMNPAAAESSTA